MMHNEPHGHPAIDWHAHTDPAPALAPLWLKTQGGDIYQGVWNSVSGFKATGMPLGVHVAGWAPRNADVDLIANRIAAVDGVESSLLFVYNDDATKVSVQVFHKGLWVVTPELDDNESACFHLLAMLDGCDA